MAYFRLFTLGVVILTLSACSSTLKIDAVTDATQDKELSSKAFAIIPDSANVYVRMNDNWYDLSSTIWANGTKVGVFDSDRFLNFSASPGTYEFRVAHNYTNTQTNLDGGYLISLFDLKLEAGSVVLIDCDRVDVAYTGYKRTTDSVLQKVSDSTCEGEFNTVQNGVSSCVSPYLQTGTLNSSYYGPYGYEHSTNHVAPDTPLAACRLIDDKSAYSSMSLAEPIIDQVYSDRHQFQVTKSENNIAAYQTFIRDWPNSEYVSNAKAAIQQLEQRQLANARLQQAEQWEAQITNILDRDSRLPVQVQHDKNMVALTDLLANENYADSLLYFDVLNRIPVAQSPSFSYFWGEALLKTGQPQPALDKLYTYLEVAGRDGQYYRQALELINQAQAAL